MPGLEMRLHTVFITYNRLELTKRAVSSYLETVTLPYSVWLADNASKDSTQDWINELFADGLIDGMILFKNNMYPGYAANEAWAHASENVTHLHRADNDFIYLPNWCNEVERRFSKNQRLGQLGLRTNKEERFAKGNVGGNCVISKELWDKGLRWDERPWPQLAEEVGPGWTEDSLMSTAVKKLGYQWGRVENSCIESISQESFEDEYYLQSWRDRKIWLD